MCCYTFYSLERIETAKGILFDLCALETRQRKFCCNTLGGIRVPTQGNHLAHAGAPGLRLGEMVRRET